MDGQRGLAGALGDSPCGSSGGCGEQEGEFCVLGVGDERFDDGGFSSSWSTGENGDGLLGYFPQRAFLLFGELEGEDLSNACERGVINGGRGKFGSEQFMDEQGGFVFFLKPSFEVDGIAGSSSTFVSDEYSVLDQSVDRLFDIEVVASEECFCALYGGVLGEIDVSFEPGFMQRMFYGGCDTSGVFAADPCFLGDFIGGEKSDTTDVSGESVGVIFDDRDRHLAVVTVDAVGKGRTNSVGLEKDHDASDGLMLSPSVCDGFASSFSDAFYFTQSFGVLVEDGDGLFAEMVDDSFGEARADSFDEVGGEEADESFSGAGQ